ncbi:hypothetical protein LOK49_LG01G02246 [Camellia lanceoleosa]|uniref:Uncharacterized protein n=1 Tax=Camellia lanceoleosa TaxID=1840588 RepID=A0ACC0J4Y8_9ERIC|nr:hypothetical protein LOK49_LG01G02246 [Camellia lanceoleosa]
MNLFFFGTFLTRIFDLLQEKILEIEYIKAVAPRKEEEPSLHDDWVNAVDGSNPGKEKPQLFLSSQERHHQRERENNIQ